jgi:hypothetical protein
MCAQLRYVCPKIDGNLWGDSERVFKDGGDGKIFPFGMLIDHMINMEKTSYCWNSNERLLRVEVHDTRIWGFDIDLWKVMKGKYLLENFINW